MWAWITTAGTWLKNAVTIISRVMRLENRVTALESKISTLQAPPKDIKEGLIYDRVWNFYSDKATGENFCPACLGNGKKIPVYLKQGTSDKWWQCSNCKATHYR